MLITLIFFILFIHGLGHFQGVMITRSVEEKDHWNANSWLIGDMMNHNAERTICMLLYLVTALSGISSAFSFNGILLPAAAWDQLALMSAVFSCVSIFLYTNGLTTTFNKIAAMIINLAIFYIVIFGKPWINVVL
ncbi:MAG: hypothetical protein KJP00_10315 [Bacteroidia bacterium]|nr:hypothetical protein [Bacteroidia bacterium]